MRGKIVARRGHHALICDGWEYYDRAELRRIGDGGKAHTTARHVGTYPSDAEAIVAWLHLLGIKEVSA